MPPSFTFALQVTVCKPDITTPSEAYDFGVELREHILDTFNDDDSITGADVLPPEVKRQPTAAEEALLDKAYEMYATDTLNIAEPTSGNPDPSDLFSEGLAGTWVRAWVLVPKTDT